MVQYPEFVDLLLARRKDRDILWASRPMDPLLPHKLPPESRYSRNQMIQSVLNHEKVKSTIASLAAIRQTDISKIEKEASMMINEMASKAHLATVRWLDTYMHPSKTIGVDYGYLYTFGDAILYTKKYCILSDRNCEPCIVHTKRLAIIITKVLKRIFLSIYINEGAMIRMKKEMQISQVQYVYAPTHRSYLDFILVSYVLFSYDMALPNIASGMDFYQMHVIGEILRKTGAFYMRRSFSDDSLYKTIFRSYVMSLVKHSDRAIEFFIEGTRSRSLKSIAPKFGLLSIILESLLEGSVPDIHFIPISISYERPPEELLFAYELLGVPKPKESTAGLLQSLSILQKPYAYGRVFFNIGEPISTSQFLNMKHRKERILSPYVKLQSNTTKELAYHIIDSHKKNTVLMPFNLITLLFNERTQMNPDDPYTLDTLVSDYLWCKDLLQKFNATVCTGNSDDAKEEIFNTLGPHKELLAFDASEILRLKERHKPTKLNANIRVKGHSLSDKTMQIAVSVINMSIYLNPTLSFLIQPAIVVVAVGMEGVEVDVGFKRYALLRTLLSTEFAMPLIEDESVLKSEWDETLHFLLKQNYICIRDGIYIHGQDLKVFSLLYNVLLPFIDAIYVTCLVLFEWEESKSNYVTVQGVLTETQKRVEEAFLERSKWGQHPYSLSLDLYNTTVCNLTAQGILMSHEKRGAYEIDKVRLAVILAQLQNLSLRRPPGLYCNAILLSELPLTLQAKL